MCKRMGLRRYFGISTKGNKNGSDWEQVQDVPKAVELKFINMTCHPCQSAVQIVGFFFSLQNPKTLEQQQKCKSLRGDSTGCGQAAEKEEIVSAEKSYRSYSSWQTGV